MFNYKNLYKIGYEVISKYFDPNSAAFREVMYNAVFTVMSNLEDDPVILEQEAYNFIEYMEKQ